MPSFTHTLMCIIVITHEENVLHIMACYGFFQWKNVKLGAIPLF